MKSKCKVCKDDFKTNSQAKCSRHSFTNSRFNNQKFVAAALLSIKYKCALKKLVKSQSGHAEMIDHAEMTIISAWH